MRQKDSPTGPQFVTNQADHEYTDAAAVHRPITTQHNKTKGTRKTYVDEYHE